MDAELADAAIWNADLQTDVARQRLPTQVDKVIDLVEGEEGVVDTAEADGDKDQDYYFDAGEKGTPGGKEDGEDDENLTLKT